MTIVQHYSPFNGIVTLLLGTYIVGLSVHLESVNVSSADYHHCSVAAKYDNFSSMVPRNRFILQSDYLGNDEVDDRNHSNVNHDVDDSCYKCTTSIMKSFKSTITYHITQYVISAIKLATKSQQLYLCPKQNDEQFNMNKMNIVTSIDNILYGDDKVIEEWNHFLRRIYFLHDHL